MDKLDHCVAPFLTSTERRTMWSATKDILGRLKSAIPITKVQVLGSFTTSKPRPADVDLVVFVRTKDPSPRSWSVDIVFAPDTQHGEEVFQDAKAWVKEKYGDDHTIIELPITDLGDQP